MSTVLATVGTIPGAGTTTVSAALAAALGEQRSRVGLVDATAEGSRIGDVFPLDGDGELTDALRRGAAIGDVQTAGPHDVSVFPATADTAWGSVRPDAVADTYDALRERFEYVIVDCGSGLDPASAAWLGHADEVLVVTDPDVAGTVDEIAALARAFDVGVRGIVANRVPMPAVEEALEDLAATDLPVLAVLPEDPAVGAAEAAGASLLAHDPDSPIATVAWAFASAIRDRAHDEPVVPQGTVSGRVPGGGEGATGEDTAPDSTSRTKEAGGDPGEVAADYGQAGEPGAEGTAADAGRGDATEDRATAEEHPTGTAVGPPRDSTVDERADDSAPGDSSATDDVDPTDIDLEMDVASTGDTAGAAADAESDAPDRSGDAESAGDDSVSASGTDSVDAFEFDTAARPSSESADAADERARTEEGETASTGVDDGTATETEDAGTGTASAGTDGDASGGSDAGDGPTDAEGNHTAEEAGGNGHSAVDAESEADAELSDEEIEAVFKETMQRVQQRRDDDDPADDAE